MQRQYGRPGHGSVIIDMPPTPKRKNSRDRKSKNIQKDDMKKAIVGFIILIAFFVFVYWLAFGGPRAPSDTFKPSPHASHTKQTQTDGKATQTPPKPKETPSTKPDQPPPKPTTLSNEDPEKTRLMRQKSVRDGFLHVWSGYKKYAWGKDELQPVSKTGKGGWGGMAATMVDALDTCVPQTLSQF